MPSVSKAVERLPNSRPPLKDFARPESQFVPLTVAFISLRVRSVVHFGSLHSCFLLLRSGIFPFRSLDKALTQNGLVRIPSGSSKHLNVAIFLLLLGDEAV